MGLGEKSCHFTAIALVELAKLVFRKIGPKKMKTKQIEETRIDFKFTTFMLTRYYL